MIIAKVEEYEIRLLRRGLSQLDYDQLIEFREVLEKEIEGRAYEDFEEEEETIQGRL